MTDLTPSPQVTIITTGEPAITYTGTYVDETETDVIFRDEWGDRLQISKDRISHYSIA